MSGGRVDSYVDRVQARLRTAFAVDHPPDLIAASFAVGCFVTALPTLGTGLIALSAIGYRFQGANWIALFSPVVILNPVVKGGVYVASLALGVAVLGPVPGLLDADVSPTEGRAVLLRLLVGNVIIAALCAASGYGVALYGTTAIRAYRE